MTTPNELPTRKVHPATREILPDDPLQMHGCELPGDPRIMLRLLVQEYAHLGWGAHAILALARDPQHRAFHGLYRLFGEEEFHRQVVDILARCGVFRVKAWETNPIEPELVQISNIAGRKT